MIGFNSNPVRIFKQNRIVARCEPIFLRPMDNICANLNGNLVNLIDIFPASSPETKMM